MNESEVQALNNLVNCNWDAEERDYNEQDAEGRENHIFRDLVRLRTYLIWEHGK